MKEKGKRKKEKGETKEENRKRGKRKKEKGKKGKGQVLEYAVWMRSRFVFRFGWLPGSTPAKAVCESAYDTR